MDQVLYSTPDNPAPENRTEGFFETHDGHQLRYAVFRSSALVAKGTVVILHGRNEYIEKYFETIRDLTAKGLWVATFDMRGQGGSQRLLKSRNHGHIRRFVDYERDLDTFLEKVVLPDTRLPFYLLAHSTGGLIALSAAPYLTTRIDRMVLSAPFIGLTGQSASPRVIRALAGTLTALGLGFLPLTSKLKEPNFSDNPLTSDEHRFERNVAMMKAHPELTLGPPTARWLIEAFRTMDRVTSPYHLFSITIDHRHRPDAGRCRALHGAGAALALFPRRPVGANQRRPSRDLPGTGYLPRRRSCRPPRLHSRQRRRRKPGRRRPRHVTRPLLLTGRLARLIKDQQG